MAAVEIGESPTRIAPTAPVLALTDLKMRYSADRPMALDGVSLQVRSGEFVALLGANGSGKTTLLRCAVGLVKPTGGSVRLLGHDLTALRGRQLCEARLDMALVFQDGRLVRRRTALANVASGALGRYHTVLSTVGRLPREALEYGLETLDRLGLAAIARQRADTLSGGQARRVAIARALAQRPTVLLADEPVASLDPDACLDVMQLLADLARDRGLAVLCVLHQPELATQFADRIVGITRGAVVFDLPTASVSSDHIATLYRDEGR